MCMFYSDKVLKQSKYAWGSSTNEASSSPCKVAIMSHCEEDKQNSVFAYNFKEENVCFGFCSLKLLLQTTLS